MAKDDLNHLYDAMGELLVHCREAGFSLPLYVTAVGANGMLQYARYTPDENGQGLAVEPLAEYLVAGSTGFVLPINIVVCDTEGQAARLVLEHGGTKRISTLH